MRRAHEILVIPSETKNHSGFVVTIKYALIFVEEDRSTYLHILPYRKRKGQRKKLEPLDLVLA